MIVLGIILLIIGFIAAIHIIWILGIIALVSRRRVCHRRIPGPRDRRTQTHLLTRTQRRPGRKSEPAGATRQTF